MACRSEKKAEDAIAKMKTDHPDLELKLTYMQCDLSSLENVRQFAQKFQETGLPIHVLMNNAGQ